MKHCILTTFLILLISLTISCEQGSNRGELLIKSPSGGQYELYKISSETPLQLISENRGSYNKTEILESGQYLVMADCSYKIIIINPNEKIELISHDIEFIKPEGAETAENFTIQCHRFTQNHTTQKIKGRFKLKILNGSHEILVAMKPLRFNFDDTSKGKEPSTIKQQLSAIRVNPIEGFSDPTMYFVSPVSELLSITSFQRTAEWFLLLDGDYMVELNGSKKRIKVEKGQTHNVATSTVKVEVSKKTTSRFIKTRSWPTTICTTK